MNHVYKQLTRSGALSLTLGIVSIVAAAALGTLAIINGARLLGERRKLEL